MSNLVLGALLVAVLSGVAIGVQGTFINLSGRLAGAFTTGLLVNAAAGLAAFVVLGVLLGRSGSVSWGAAQGALPYWGLAGVIGVGIVTGVAFALPRVGVAAGLAGLILGQMLIAFLIDAAGWGGAKIPFSAPRLLGLALLVAAVWFIVPKE